MQLFSGYIGTIDTYISPVATFPTDIWSNYAATIVRTTNGCESYHSRLNQRFYSHIPIFLIYWRNIRNIVEDVCKITKHEPKKEKYAW